MIIGERRSKNLASNYASNPLRPYMESFSNAIHDIADQTTIDFFTEATRVVQNKGTNELLKRFFVENSYDADNMTPEEIQDHIITMEAQYENDREAVLENTNMGTVNPIIGLTFPLHKFILMNMVFDKGAIPKLVAQSPKFTISMEYRILIDTEGNEIDMFKDQNAMTAAIDATAPLKEFEIDLANPLTADQEIVNAKMGGVAGVDHLSIETKVSAVKVKDVYFEVGDILPNDEGYVEFGNKIAETATTSDVWVRVDAPYVPMYGDNGRGLIYNFAYKCKKNDGSSTTVQMVKDILQGNMKDDRLSLTALHKNIAAAKIQSRIDTSNARAKTCSVKWKEVTDIVEIPNAIPINTTVSPEEIKDINALYNVNHLTKIMSMIKTVLGNYKDDKILEFLNNSYKSMDDDSKMAGQFNFAPRQGYDGDHVNWRKDTFFDYFDTKITEMLQVLNDPNVVVTVFGAPDIVRKITPTSYQFQSPSNIGPVELDYTKTVTTSDRRVYQFIGSDKLRGETELIVILCPRGTDRIIYRIYDYQMYMSNEIRNYANPALPAIHAFERWKMIQYQPVQGRINILNPTGLVPETYDYIPIKNIS